MFEGDRRSAWPAQAVARVRSPPAGRQKEAVTPSLLDAQLWVLCDARSSALATRGGSRGPRGRSRPDGSTGGALAKRRRHAAPACRFAGIILAFDDRIERRRGKCIATKGLHRDAVRSSDSHLVNANGLRWMSLMLLAPVP